MTGWQYFEVQRAILGLLDIADAGFINPRPIHKRRRVRNIQAKHSVVIVIPIFECATPPIDTKEINGAVSRGPPEEPSKHKAGFFRKFKLEHVFSRKRLQT